MHGHDGPVTGVVFANENEIITSGADTTLRRWNLESGSELARVVAHTNIIVSLAISPDRKRLVTCDRGRVVQDQGRVSVITGQWSEMKVWDLQTMREILSLRSQLRRPYKVAFSPDGRWVASGYGDGTIRLWDARTGLSPSNQQEENARLEH